MAKKMMAVLLVCIMVVAALQFSTANDENKVKEEVAKFEAKFEAKFVSCYENCEKECLQQRSGQSFCEVKCDEDCGAKEVADKLHIKVDRIPEI